MKTHHPRRPLCDVRKEKHLVIGFDPAEQEVFYDLVVAESETAAKARVDAARPYARAICAIDSDELLRLAIRLSGMTRARIETEWNEQTSAAEAGAPFPIPARIPGGRIFEVSV